MRSSKSLIYRFIFVIGLTILVNLIFENFSIRLDFTSDKAYTLSKSTKTLLKSLKEPVTITAYFSKEVPPELTKARNDFKALLTEYSTISTKKINFEFIDPTGKEDIEKKAQQAGIQPVMVGSREKDQVKQQKAYLGATVQYGAQTEVIPIIQPGAAMEYALSTAIKKISIVNKQLIGFIQGHGEPSLSALQQVYGALNIMYEVDPVYLNDTTYFLSKYKTLVVVAPKDSVSENHLNQFDRYLSEGGNLLIALNRVEGELSQNRGIAVNTGFEKWMEKKGILINESFIVDAVCGVVEVQVEDMGFSFPRQLQFPYFPVLKTFGKHPVTEGLEAIILSFASSVSYKGDSSKLFMPLVITSDKSAEQALPVTFDLNREWKEEDFSSKNLVVAAALQGNFGGSKANKMIVIGDGDLAVNGEGEKAQPLNPDNVNFFMNAIDWLSDDTGLIELRTKGVTARPLDKISDSVKLFLKIFNFALPILLIIGYGIWRFHSNQKLRLKRMEEGYI